MKTLKSELKHRSFSSDFHSLISQEWESLENDLCQLCFSSLFHSSPSFPPAFSSLFPFLLPFLPLFLPLHPSFMNPTLFHFSTLPFPLSSYALFSLSPSLFLSLSLSQVPLLTEQLDVAMSKLRWCSTGHLLACGDTEGRVHIFEAGEVGTHAAVHTCACVLP